MAEGEEEEGEEEEEEEEEYSQRGPPMCAEELSHL